MKKNVVVFPVLILGIAGLAFSQAPVTAAPAPAAPAPAAAVAPPVANGPAKIGIIFAQNAILMTKEGQKAADGLNKKFQPKKDAMEKKQASIQAMQDQLKKGAATLSAEAQAKLRSDIDANTKSLTRDNEDAQAELDDEQGKIMQELGAKMMDVLGKYSNEHSYTIILDVSNQQTPVLWSAPGTDITQEIVKLYDQKYPVTEGTAAAPAGAKPPAAPAGTAVRPPAAPKK